MIRFTLTILTPLLALTTIIYFLIGCGIAWSVATAVGIFVLFWTALTAINKNLNFRKVLELSERAKWKHIPLSLDCQFCKTDNDFSWCPTVDDFKCGNCKKVNKIKVLFVSAIPPDFEEDDTVIRPETLTCR